MNYTFREIFERFNSLCLASVTGAAQLASNRGNPEVDLAHFLMHLLNQADSDLHRILKAFGIELSGLLREVTSAVESLKSGAKELSGYSDIIGSMGEKAWMLASLKYISGDSMG